MRFIQTDVVQPSLGMGIRPAHLEPHKTIVNQ
jgi:hypothetical protein